MSVSLAAASAARRQQAEAAGRSHIWRVGDADGRAGLQHVQHPETRTYVNWTSNLQNPSLGAASDVARLNKGLSPASSQHERRTILSGMDETGGGDELGASQECFGVKKMMAVYCWGAVASQTPDSAAGRKASTQARATFGGVEMLAAVS
ncbi:hypothetical protein LTR56_014617 [Elasticomyces elasticus]|nr:hypothetical protein LTR56_014617 [Elasticomyces elasticus]KAK3646751.1 hypothetical protein LTR22_014127 [Elasticomyces elasticus]KAK4916407.1 hypothetical protein LTR49_015641 [Elasticomyces elasticus]KAK5749060.1 hypothetical protein LTS12_020891 [Elasticomyces elasticus]